MIDAHSFNGIQFTALKPHACASDFSSWSGKVSESTIHISFKHFWETNTTLQHSLPKIRKAPPWVGQVERRQRGECPRFRSRTPLAWTCILDHRAASSIQCQAMRGDTRKLLHSDCFDYWDECDTGDDCTYQRVTFALVYSQILATHVAVSHTLAC
ncbi:hypothetical protein K474DRAFT_1015020 [Panus rudis PR-1116 ss-1]|nr:hypothetical protein K474DRAFT_1015020 [Panus rudis PR-1116 ss-1]